MSYTISSFDGNFTIPTLSVDTSNTALSLPGKNWNGWGQAYDNNFVLLLQNFAGNEPTIKRTGMLWYDTANSVVKVWDSRIPSWNTISNTGNGTATKLTNAVTIALSCAVTGSVSFDGSQSVTIAATLSNSGVTSGTYQFSTITVNSKGLITSASSANTPVTSFAANGIAARGGDVVMNYNDVVAALGYAPIAGLTNSGVTPGTYPMADVTVNNYGIISNIVRHTLTSSEVTVALGYTPLSGFPTTGVTAGHYTAANITVDAYGRITAASSTSPLIANGSVSNSLLSQMAPNTFKANLSGVSASPSDATVPLVLAALGFGSGLSSGAITTGSTSTGTWIQIGSIIFQFGQTAAISESMGAYPVSLPKTFPTGVFSGAFGATKVNSTADNTADRFADVVSCTTSIITLYMQYTAGGGGGNGGTSPINWWCCGH